MAVVVGASGSMAAAALHIAILPLGPDGLRYFGADQRLVELAEQGSRTPILITTAIAAALATAGLYGLAQAGRRQALPWQPRVYQSITALYLLRGIAIVPQLALQHLERNIGPPRELVFSAVTLALGILHLPGLRAPAVQLEAALS